MTPEQAKKIVLEKYPKAVCVDDMQKDMTVWSFILEDADASPLNCIGDGDTQDSAWLNAAERITAHKE